MSKLLLQDALEVVSNTTDVCQKIHHEFQQEIEKARKSKIICATVEFSYDDITYAMALIYKQILMKTDDIKEVNLYTDYIDATIEVIFIK